MVLSFKNFLKGLSICIKHHFSMENTEEIGHCLADGPLGYKQIMCKYQPVFEKNLYIIASMNKKLLAVILLAFLLRIILISSVPPHLRNDEASVDLG